ncbi:vesicle-associated protein 1-2 [Oryza brachyantha]|uniref:MSP domain-containing protein n=1 Tax=Oryza brachyantha TaxID=4533 RepID=J3N3Y2_ORYBR|nr:vesicle-associated protein 1-2 [Oryza brachyantha]
MAASCGLVDVEPPELQFPFELDKQISCPLKITNRTEKTVAFKVKTTSPRKYCVRPNNGVVQPRSACVVVVTMQEQIVAPPDLQCKDKFLVQSVVVSDGLSAKDVTSQMFMKYDTNMVEEVKLKVAYVMPPEPPLEIAEESDVPRRIMVPMQRILDNGRSASELSSGNVSLRSAEMGTEVGSPLGRFGKNEDLLKTAGPVVETRIHAGADEQYHELSSLVSKLTEEKKSALEQNRKLREELELVRRQVSQKQGGFSLAFVLVIALLSIILGCLVKK